MPDPSSYYYHQDPPINAQVQEIYRLNGMCRADPMGTMGAAIAAILAQSCTPDAPTLHLVVSGDPDHFTRACQRYLDRGFLLHGAPFAWGIQLVQAMFYTPVAEPPGLEK